MNGAALLFEMVPTFLLHFQSQISKKFILTKTVIFSQSIVEIVAYILSVAVVVSSLFPQSGCLKMAQILLLCVSQKLGFSRQDSGTLSDFFSFSAAAAVEREHLMVAAVLGQISFQSNS